mmetsp:Transcript_6922/g.18722  ORF Transcript_6922/g.18722 Transcript_6922/m.18722 type:complete len:89 (-) Transcript_6922:83-349(-)
MLRQLGRPGCALLAGNNVSWSKRNAGRSVSWSKRSAAVRMTPITICAVDQDVRFVKIGSSSITWMVLIGKTIARCVTDVEDDLVKTFH